MKQAHRDNRENELERRNESMLTEEQADAAFQFGITAAREVVHDGDWDDRLDEMLAAEWRRLANGGAWELAQPLVKEGWREGRVRIGRRS